MENSLEKFVAKPFSGRFLVVSEYRDGHGGGTAPVVDLITVDLSLAEDPTKYDRYVSVPAACDSALYDSLVELEIWPNGEVYLSGDGLNHQRYRVTGMHEFDVATTLDASDDLTTRDGTPVWWGIPEFVQDSYPNQPGVKVEMGIWHNFLTSRPGWEFRKAFSDKFEPLINVATAELEKPKYGSIPRAIKVDGRVIRSWFTDHMPSGHELSK